MVESQFVKEREQLQSQTLKLHNQMTNDLMTAQAQELKSRQANQQLELERNTLQLKLDDMIKLNQELKQQLHISELNQRKLEEMESNHNSVLESQQRSMSDQLNFMSQVNKKLRDENDELITELTNKDQQIQRLSGIIDQHKQTPPESLKMETGHSLIDHHIKQQQTHNQPLYARVNNFENNCQPRGNSSSSRGSALGSENVTTTTTATATVATATNSNLNASSVTTPLSTTGATATKKQSNSRFKQRRNEYRGGRQGYRQRPT